MRAKTSIALLLAAAGAVWLASCRGGEAPGVPATAAPNAIAYESYDDNASAGLAARGAFFNDGSGSDVRARTEHFFDELARDKEELLVIERGKARGDDDELRGGELRVVADGEEKQVPLPLQHSDVKAKITLHVGSVRLRQTYHNPYDQKIEAVYVFPLPQNAAVTDFVMQIGERRIRGIIREREEAQRIYRRARAAGHTASLLTQERPDVFTQSVANIEPGKQIDVEIAYFHTLRYRAGTFEFVLPMVVGPRFNPPGSTDGIGAVPIGGGGSSGQATEVAYLRPNEISPHLLSLQLDLDVGVDIENLESPSHALDVQWNGRGAAHVTLKEGETIPNRDFVLRYSVARDDVHGAVAVHRDSDGGGTFAMLLHPPVRMPDLPQRPREMIFVVDCSGSMEGEPLAACQRAIRRCLDRMRPDDTFSVIRFSDTATAMRSGGPEPATPENLRRARRYVGALEASGGTMMINGIRAALEAPHDPRHRRIVTFMTDGYIGNEREILAAVHDRVGDARIFSFGVGSAPNRYLLERMAAMGRGVAAYLALEGSGERQIDALFERLENPVLQDLAVDWHGLDVREVYPAPLPDLFAGSPVAVTGRFRGELPSHVTVSGQMGDGRVEIELPLTHSTEDPALTKLWARAKISHLDDNMTWMPDTGELAQAITDVSLEHGVISQFTAFVAADASRRTEGDHGVTVQVPVPVPAGVHYDTTVGK